MGYIKKLKSNELVGGTDKHTVYPVTSAEAVFEEVSENNFQSQKAINVDRLERIETLEDHDENHEGRVSTLEDHDSDHESRVQDLEQTMPTAVKSITINKGTKIYTVDDEGNVNLTVYTTESEEGQAALSEVVENQGFAIGEINAKIGTNTTENTLSGRIADLETAVGDGGSVDERIAVETTRATEAEAFLQDEYDTLYQSLSGTDIIIGAKPSTGQQTNKIYRVPGDNNGTANDAYYTDYMWYNNAWVRMATYEVANLESQVSYYKCTTAAGTAAKVVNATMNPNHPHLDSYEKIAGGHFKVWMQKANTAASGVTLKIGSADAATLIYNGEPVTALNTWEEEEVLSVYYDPTYNSNAGAYMASNSQGGNKKLETYIYNDLRLLSLGQTYKAGEAVKTNNKQLVRVAKDIKDVKLTEIIASGDLKTDGTNTYKALQAVAAYNGTESEGLYAIGSPAGAEIQVTVDSEAIALLEEETPITVTIVDIEITVNATAESTALTIAAAIATAFGTKPEWSLTDNEDGTLTLKSKVGKDTAPTISSSTGDTGVTIAFETNSVYAGSVSLSQYSDSEWAPVTKADWLADTNMWEELTLSGLISNYTEQNSVVKDLSEEELPTAYTLDNHERRIRETENNKLGEDEEFVIAKALTLGTSGDAAGSSFSGVVTINNSDNILIFGMSFGAGYAMNGKHWTDIVSMFSDYTYCNKSLGGTSAIDMMNKLLYGSTTPRPNSRYALILCSGNTNVNQDYLLQEIDNMCKVCLSLGITPIVGTNHRNYLANTQECMYMTNLYRNYCNQNHYLFIDSAEYWRLLKDARYDFQSHGSHLDNWSMPVEAYPYMYYLDGLERPVKSIKLFTPRETVTNLNDLVFNNNIMRAKRFREYYMNNYTDSTLTFSKGYALISAIVPCVQTNTSLISLELDASSSITVYVRNTRSENYPKKTGKQTRFLISSDVSVWPSVGNTYTFNGTTFTINHISKGTIGEEGYEHHEGAYADFYCTPDLDNGGSTTPGELTIATGSGDALISFAGYETGTTWSSDKNLVDAYIGGKWVVLSPDVNGKYTMTNLYGIMDVDKVDFLVKSNNEESFSIASGSIKVSWKASEMKNNYFRTPVEEFHSNYTRTTDELIAEPTFGAAGTTQSTWKDGNGNYLVSEANYEKTVLNKNGFYPMDATSVIKISNTVSMNYTIPANSLREFGDIVIEVVARFWNGYTENLTTDSWDFNELYVGFGGHTYSGRTYSKFSDQVGLYWKICQFRVTITHDTALSNDYQPLPLKIYAEKAGMEIARVSVKYVSKL